MNNHIASIGTANPGEAIPQMQIGRFMKLAHGLEDTEARKLNFVYRLSGIQNRYSVLEDFKHVDPSDFEFFPKNESLEPFPSTQSRMEVFRKEAAGLAIRAIDKCLGKTSTLPSEITHLIMISCTGMYAPGVEMDIIHKMGFSTDVERYAIHFMGCYASFNGLKLADRICDSEPEAKVLLISVELCTLHFQKTYNDNNLLANAIFGDGAAAALVTKNGPGLKIKKYKSQILREGEEDMAWSIGDFGFEMKLSKYIPELLNNGIKRLSESLEANFNLSKIPHFAIHPGGKQILQKVEEAFGISSAQNQASHDILSAFGNMSSATILFVLEKWLDQEGKKGDILAMGFGPGLTLETLLLEK